MKNDFINLLTRGKTLVRVKDRTGVYKLPSGNPIPHFGPAGRQKAAPAPAVRPIAAAEQSSLFKATEPAKTAPGKPEAPSAPVQVKVGRSPGARILPAIGSSLRRIWQLVPRLPRPAKIFTRRRAQEVRPRAQAELALEKVTVLRNDLSESDLVVVPVLRKADANAPAAGNPWRRVTARWIKLKETPAAGATAEAPERRGQLAGMES